jgi:hypothetical protein
VEWTITIILIAGTKIRENFLNLVGHNRTRYHESNVHISTIKTMYMKIVAPTRDSFYVQKRRTKQLRGPLAIQAEGRVWQRNVQSRTRFGFIQSWKTLGWWLLCEFCLNRTYDRTSSLLYLFWAYFLQMECKRYW